MLNTKYKLRDVKYNIFLIILLLFGFFYRLYGLEQNYSFWSDETHAAIFSRAILQTGKPTLGSGFSTKIFQWGLYWITAASMKIFRISEFSARLPILIFGTLTIYAVFLLGRKLFNEKVGLLAAFFTAFLDIEILWSRQLRPYQILQFFWVLGTFFSFKFLKNKSKKDIILASLCGFLSVLLQPLGVMFFVFQLVFYFLLWLREPKRRDISLGITLFLLIGAIVYKLVPAYLNLFKRLGQANNFFYYRVFLTHNYLPLVLLCLLGFYFLLRKKKMEEFVFFALILGLQTFVVSFLAIQPFVRYFYPSFSFIIILASYGLWETGEFFSAKIKDKNFLISVFLILLVVFSFWKTGKLSIFPKKIYSLNADMQEIPEIDWKKLYVFVGEKLKSNPKAILVANWMDTPVWFLGEGKLDFLVRNSKLKVDSLSGAKYINSFDKFQDLITEESAGIVVLDSWDTAVPEEIREYCHDNLKKELEIDRLYPVQPRYWTVWVYSWGYEGTGY